jgi:hypothetical protein
MDWKALGGKGGLLSLAGESMGCRLKGAGVVNFLATEGTDLVGGDLSQEPQLTRRGNAATELREAFGVCGACSRFRTAPHLTTAAASWTHSKRFAQISASLPLCAFTLIHPHFRLHLGIRLSQ